MDRKTGRGGYYAAGFFWKIRKRGMQDEEYNAYGNV